jgi:hypothetical protein
MIGLVRVQVTGPRMEFWGDVAFTTYVALRWAPLNGTRKEAFGLVAMVTSRNADPTPVVPP